MITFYNYHHTGPDGLDIAFFSWFMEREQFREQAATGITSLVIAVPKGIKFQLILYGTAVYHVSWECSLWHNGKKMALERNHWAYKWKSGSIQYVSKVESEQKNNGVYRFHCLGSYSCQYASWAMEYARKNKSLNITFVTGWQR